MPDNVTDIIGGGGHTLFLTANGRCYSCGWNSKGQLGLGLVGQQNEVTVPKPISEQYFSESFIKVAAGWDHSMTITGNDVYTCGSGRKGQLGYCGPDGKPVSKSDNFMKAMEQFTGAIAMVERSKVADEIKDVNFISIFSDSSIDSSIMEQELFYLQYIVNSTPIARFMTSIQVERGDSISVFKAMQKVPLPDCCGRIIQVAAGANHSALVTDTGQLIVWGDNKHGQLAMDPDLKPVQHEPVILPEHLFEKEKIVQVYSGWTHMLALTETGLVYTWGRAKYGQLGTAGASDENSSRWQPHLLAITNPKRIVCGAEHNMLISDGDELLTWGWNEHGMCGSGDTVDIFEPQKIQSFTHWKVTAIGCGSGHSFACVTS
ncbi:hypothetical protein LSH36_20g06007 [Paralvinella palmiformis]|uniref:RCC1-like domain-containing protein n=1 Tax=Paralvinella palmiformis TaxID=53620 RepID=A0AAD9KB89_9ANNE|nr:hypothetical protein LSH36_20g06007 [Paralvinella palmiformis]